ncbi:MAG: hypothetical protein RL113_1339, partial [Pseudomonadota bacterium]
LRSYLAAYVAFDDETVSILKYVTIKKINLRIAIT